MFSFQPKPHLENTHTEISTWHWCLPMWLRKTSLTTPSSSREPRTYIHGLSLSNAAVTHQNGSHCPFSPPPTPQPPCFSPLTSAKWLITVRLSPHSWRWRLGSLQGPYSLIMVEGLLVDKVRSVLQGQMTEGSGCWAEGFGLDSLNDREASWTPG